MPTPSGSFFQFFNGNELLERSVAKECLRDPNHLKRMPTHGWIEQKQASQSGCLVFWTLEGVKRILQSGYLGWQCAVTPGEIKVRVVTLGGDPICVDKHQLLCPPSEVREQEMIAFNKLLEMAGTSIPRLRVYLLLMSQANAQSPKILVEQVANAGFDVKVPTFDLSPGQTFETIWHEVKQNWKIKSPETLQKVASGFGYSLQKKEFYQTQQWQAVMSEDSPLQEGPSFADSMTNSTYAVRSPQWLGLKDASEKLPEFIASRLRGTTRMHPTVI